MYTFGRNTDGQLGLNTRKEFKVPTVVFGLRDDKIFEVACGNDYTLALSETGSLFGWGNNQHGQLGKVPQESNQKESEKVNPKFISCTPYFSIRKICFSRL